LVCTTTRSKRARSRRHSSRFDAVRRGSRSCAVKTLGERKRRTASTCGAASHWTWSTSARTAASHTITPRCSAARNGSRARDRPRRGGPFGRRVTSLNAGLFRSSFNGQGNVILIPREWTVREHKTITLNTNPFCEEEGRKLGLDESTTRRWQRERRICQVVKA